MSPLKLLSPCVVILSAVFCSTALGGMSADMSNKCAAMFVHQTLTYRHLGISVSAQNSGVKKVLRNTPPYLFSPRAPTFENLIATNGEVERNYFSLEKFEAFRWRVNDSGEIEREHAARDTFFYGLLDNGRPMHPFFTVRAYRVRS